MFSSKLSFSNTADFLVKLIDQRPFCIKFPSVPPEMRRVSELNLVQEKEAKLGAFEILRMDQESERIL
jgi:hypothetical protein